MTATPQLIRPAGEEGPDPDRGVEGIGDGFISGQGVDRNQTTVHDAPEQRLGRGLGTVEFCEARELGGVLGAEQSDLDRV